MMSWYYESDGKQVGPFSEIEIRYHVSSGSIKPTDKIKGPDIDGWILASDAIVQLGLQPVFHSPVKDNGEIQCIKCGSSQLHSGKRGYDFWRWGIFGGSRIIITCLKCGQKFYPGGKPY